MPTCMQISPTPVSGAANEIQEPIARLGWQHGYAYAGFYPESSREQQQQTAQQDIKRPSKILSCLCTQQTTQLSFLPPGGRGYRLFSPLMFLLCIPETLIPVPVGISFGVLLSGGGGGVWSVE